MANLGKDIDKCLKSEDKRFITLDVVTNVVESNPDYAFVIGM